MGQRARVALRFSSGETIDTWHTLTLRQAFTDPLDDLTFDARPPRGQWHDYRRLLSKGEKVELFINDVSQGVYLIVTSERRTSPDGGASISAHLKTPLVTPYEGGVDPDLSLTSSTDVEVTTAILKALKPYGFDRIVAGDRGSVGAKTGKPIAGLPHRFTAVSELKHRDAVGHPDETAYAFVARIITRLGLCLRVLADGTLSVEEPDYDQAPLYTVVRTTRPGVAGDYFIDDVTVHETNEGQFSEVTARGQRSIDKGQTSAARPHAIAAASVLPTRTAYFSTVAPYKPKFFKDKSARDAAAAANVAHFELGMRAKDAFYVEGEVDGWVSQSGAIWQVNTVAHVIHEQELIDESMWLSELTRMQSADGGQRTRLRFIPLGALVLGEPGQRSRGRKKGT